MLKIGNSGKLQRLSILKQQRSKGIGKKIVKKLEAEAKKLGIKKIRLDAQITAAGFYEKMKYEKKGKSFTEVGIPHIRMEKKLI